MSAKRCSYHQYNVEADFTGTKRTVINSSVQEQPQSVSLSRGCRAQRQTQRDTETTKFSLRDFTVSLNSKQTQSEWQASRLKKMSALFISANHRFVRFTFLKWCSIWADFVMEEDWLCSSKRLSSSKYLATKHACFLATSHCFSS